MPYETVLLDLDHTLLDSEESEAAAFRDMLAAFDISSTQQLFASYRSINQPLWKAVEDGRLSPDVVRVARFRDFAAAHHLDIAPEAMAERFADGLKANGSLYPGVRAVLEELSATATLGMVTNGISDIQRARIERLGLEPFFDTIVISAEVGVAKPDPLIFAMAFEQLDGADPNSAVMVGDSLTSDMAGAAAYGIDGCWYNPEGRPRPEAPAITHEIGSVDELLGLVR